MKCRHVNPVTPYALSAVAFACLLLTLLLPFKAKAAPANDAFASQASLSNAVFVTASNLDATNDADEPIHAGQPGGRSLWWSWTAARSGSVTMGTARSEVDTLLAVFYVDRRNETPAGRTRRACDFNS